MPITITLLDLRDADACIGQRRVFLNTFGDKVLATVTTAVAHADEFDWHWAAQTFLAGDHWDAWVAETDAMNWDWDLWRDADEGIVAPAGYRARERMVAAAFAKAFLAQGGILRRVRREPASDIAF